MHFSYKNAEGESLLQGDVLKRTDELSDVLSDIHPYYQKNDSNIGFIVLTQSCDLVLGRGNPCKARYISIAPIRPLSLVLERQIQTLQISGINTSKPVSVCTSRVRNVIKQFLERVLNNNESDYFYLNAEPSKGLAVDCCAFLRLPIALRANEHYEKLINARIISIEDSFQAKLGWLVGQLFSRVGTKDWEKKELSQKVKRSLDTSVIWIDDKKEKQFLKLAKQWQEANIGQTLGLDDIEQLISTIKNRKELVIDHLRKTLPTLEPIKKMKERGEITDEDIKKLTQKLEMDPDLTSFLR